MVPLRRELFDTSDERDQRGLVHPGPVRRARRATVHGRRAGSAAQASRRAGLGRGGVARPAASRRCGQGWQLPASLPGGLPLYAAASTQDADGEVADLEYSDGLYVVSLFVQRGTLAADMPGWQPVRMAGKQAYVSGHSVTWAARPRLHHDRGRAAADGQPKSSGRCRGAARRGHSAGCVARA